MIIENLEPIIATIDGAIQLAAANTEYMMARLEMVKETSISHLYRHLYSPIQPNTSIIQLQVLVVGD